VTEPLDPDKIPNAAYTEPKLTELELGWSHLMELVNSGATRAIYWHVSDLLENVELTDDEVEALLKMPVQYRQTVAASLLEYAEIIREASRDLDSQIMRLTGEMV
jgi:hypothetical protein